MAWYSNGLTTDPAGGTVLADTGALSLTANFSVMSYADGPLALDLEHRNAANNATLHSQRYLINGSGIFTIPVTLSSLERLRVVNPNMYTGETQVSILT